MPEDLLPVKVKELFEPLTDVPLDPLYVYVAVYEDLEPPEEKLLPSLDLDPLDLETVKDDPLLLLLDPLDLETVKDVPLLLLVEPPLEPPVKDDPLLLLPPPDDPPANTLECPSLPHCSSRSCPSERHAPEGLAATLFPPPDLDLPEGLGATLFPPPEDPLENEGVGGVGITGQAQGTSIMAGAQRSVIDDPFNEPLQSYGDDDRGMHLCEIRFLRLVKKMLFTRRVLTINSFPSFLSSPLTLLVGALNNLPVPSRRLPQYAFQPEACDAESCFVVSFFFLPSPIPKPIAIAVTARAAPVILTAFLLTILIR
jgi:hypothetical protein